ncbi:unnamed protein product [Rotaria socialis]
MSKSTNEDQLTLYFTTTLLCSTSPYATMHRSFRFPLTKFLYHDTELLLYKDDMAFKNEPMDENTPSGDIDYD